MAVLRSRDNPRVRRWQKLARDARARREEGLAILEGPNLVQAWSCRRGAPQEILVVEGIDPPATATRVVSIGEAVLRAITDLPAPQGVLAVVAIPRVARDLAQSPGCLFLDAIQDAGNLGTILRSAAAFGVADVVLGPGCADPWSPKVLRAGAGAHATLALHAAHDLGAALERFGAPVHATVPRDGQPLREVPLPGRVGWLFGSEGRGLDAALAAKAATRVTIPMPGEAESLNVAACVAICLYEQARRAR